MLIIPELRTVLLLVPRTGTTSLLKAVRDAHPKSMLLYRHMEADGIPLGYDKWYKVGVVRHPVDRLWSLYKYLHVFAGRYEPAYIDRLHESVWGMTFDEWILKNNIPFCDPNSVGGDCEYKVKYAVRHILPENRKSQHVYLRPDLGTDVIQFEDMDTLAGMLGVSVDKKNSSLEMPVPQLGAKATAHIERFFEWDLKCYGNVASKESKEAA